MRGLALKRVVAGLAVFAVSVPLAGCDPVGVIEDIMGVGRPDVSGSAGAVEGQAAVRAGRVAYRASFAGALASQGEPVREGSRVTLDGVEAVGLLKIDRLARRRAHSGASTVTIDGLRFSKRGSWWSTLDFTAVENSKKGTAKGYAVARFDTGGDVCIRFAMRYGERRGTLTTGGKLRTLGGTGDGARLVAKGSFTRRFTSQGWQMSGPGEAKAGKPRPHHPACTALLERFGVLEP